MAGSSKSSGSLASRRPLSPHLQIYKPLFTMMMSIVHRLTGGALYAGTLLLVWWLVAASMGPSYYALVQDVFSTIPGRVVLVGFVWALFHHMLGGLRHFIWDTGAGLGPVAREWLSYGTLAGSILLTAATLVYSSYSGMCIIWGKL
jgi:succinate dehydrogenase / fumarate reductase, cytochrome b subunit